MPDTHKYFLLAESTAVGVFKDNSLYGPFTPADFQLIQVHFIGKIVFGITAEVTKVLSGTYKNSAFGLSINANCMSYMHETGFCFVHEVLNGVFYNWVVLDPTKFHEAHRILSLIKEGVPFSVATALVINHE